MLERDNEQLLATLLARADADVPVPRIPTDLAARLHLQRARRHRSKVQWSAGLAAAALLLVFAWPTTTFTTPKPDPQATLAQRDRTSTADAVPPEQPATVRRALQRLALEEELHERLAMQLRRVVDRPPPPAPKPLPDPIAEVQAHLDEAALALLIQADRLDRRHRLVEPARELYQDIVDIFSNSRWAPVARGRLEELQEFH